MSDKPEPLNDSYLSGQPYYCDECGLGFPEFIACEESDCRLESVESAEKRR